MTAEKNYYQILGVDYHASENDIKLAYRNLARKYHPDVNDSKNAELILASINEAYGVLSNPQKRRNYDLYKLKEFPQVNKYDKNIQDIYKKIVALRKSTVQMNKFRLDKQAIFTSLHAIINDENIAVINASDDEQLKQDLLEEVLGITVMLDFAQQKIIAEHLLKTGKDNKQINSFIKQQKTAHFFQKYQLLIAVIAGIIILVVLMNIF